MAERSDVLKIARDQEPEETYTLEKGEIGILRLGDKTLMRIVLQPGWHWAEHVKPVAGTEWCEVEHFQYVLSGRLRIRLREGGELLAEPGDTILLKPGHDARVEGDEPFVALDFIGGEEMARAFRELRRAA